LECEKTALGSWRYTFGVKFVKRHTQACFFTIATMSSKARTVNQETSPLGLHARQ
jgi:hypothetical protein